MSASFIVFRNTTIMKSLLPKLAFFAALATLPVAHVAAQSLSDQIAAAQKVAFNSGAPESDAQSIAQALGSAFGAQGDVQALLNAVAQLVGANPDQEEAVIEAAKVFAKDQAEQIEQVGRAAAQAARADGGGSGEGGSTGGAPPVPSGFGGGGGTSTSSAGY